MLSIYDITNEYRIESELHISTRYESLLKYSIHLPLHKAYAMSVSPALKHLNCFIIPLYAAAVSAGQAIRLSSMSSLARLKC